ncbi:MAG: hypothetical protein LBD74_05445 [Spirochaetaceae bacterium]|jgi:hypothetical protein|nr:hypothetical protein [Spirochaetaceae bacterium]
MTRGILLAGNESALSAAVAVEASKRVEYFTAAFIPNRLVNPDSKPLPTAAPLISLHWNPGSPVSARTLILAAENRLEHINEAILICVPPTVRKPPGALTAPEIEIMVNDHIKGWFFLVKELSALFRLKKTGTLALVLSELDSGGKEEPPDIMGLSAVESFRAFTQSLLQSSLEEPFRILGFSAPQSCNTAEFAAFIFKNLEDGAKRNNNKWLKFGKGRGLFGRY